MTTQTQRVDAKNTLELKATDNDMSGEYIYGGQLLLVANDDLEEAHGTDYDGVSSRESSSGTYTMSKGGLGAGKITFTNARVNDREGIKTCIGRISKKTVAFS